VTAVNVPETAVSSMLTTSTGSELALDDVEVASVPAPAERL
jgi:hypothetical protein